MRTPLELLRVILGEPHATWTRLRQTNWLEVGDIELPLESFRGFPPKWVFAILIKATARDDKRAVAAILEDIHEVLDHFKHSLDRPVFLVSDDPHLHLGDEFGIPDGSVFYLDATELPREPPKRTPPKLSPFVTALRRNVDCWARPGAAKLLSPYLRAKPVKGWQFFGRHAELRELVYSRENIMLVGPRRVGKSSLMLEAERALLAAGERVHYINVQECRTSSDVIAEMLKAIDLRASTAALRRKQAFNEDILSVILRRLSRGSRGLTLLLDELGIVLNNLRPDDWRFLGTLRKFSQQDGNLRVVISCFHEGFRQQQRAFTGPMVNWLHTLSLGLFSENELREFVFGPLEFWMPLDEKQREDLLKTIGAELGYHPYFLQYYGWAMVNRLRQQPSAEFVTNAKMVMRKDIVEFFHSAVQEFYHIVPSPLLKYLFLRACKEASDKNKDMTRVQFDDAWLQGLLTGLGFASTVDGRSDIFENLEMYGLMAGVDHSTSRYALAVPIVYHYLRAVEKPLDGYIAKLRQDSEADWPNWHLTPLVKGSHSSGEVRPESAS